MKGVLELEHEIDAVLNCKSLREYCSRIVETDAYNIRNNRRKTTSKRRVQFAIACDEIKPTLHVLEYTFDEKRQTWYNLDDLETIKKERKSTIKRMNKGSLLKKGQCTRGLEAYTREGSKIRHQLIADSIEAVMREQSGKDTNIECKHGHVAKIYGAYALPCQLAAYERGLGDCASIDESDSESVGSDISQKLAEYMENTCSAGMGNEQEHGIATTNIVVSWQRS